MQPRGTNIKYVSGVSSYVINWADDVVNVDTSSTAVTVYLPSLATGGTNKRFYINDYNGNAATNNITIATSGTDVVNGSATKVLSADGVTSEILVSGVGEWLANTDAPTSSGTVTSVALTMPAIFSVTGSPITGSGTFAVSLATQSANTVFAGPTSGGAATPAFRALVAADLPAGTGTVTSVALTMPSIFSVSGSPVTTSGTLAASLATQSANTVFAGPTSGGAATPAFRALVSADIPSLTGTYYANGGNAFAGNATIGLTDNYGLSILTNNTTRINILNTGPVGIGVTTPTRSLEVLNNISVNGVGSSYEWYNGSAYFTALYMTQGVGSSNVSVGHNNTLNDADNGGAIAIGSGVTSSSDGIAIGLSAYVEAGTIDGIAIGRGATVDTSSIRGIAIGRQAYARANNATALGNYSVATVADTVIIGNVHTGTNPNVGIGELSSPSARLEVRATTEQLRISYDASNYYSTTVGSTGIVTFNAVGSGSSFIFSDAFTMASSEFHTGVTSTSGPGAVAITGRVHEITTTGTGDALTLADGSNGQRLTIAYIARAAGSDTAILTPTNLAGSATTITFTDLGQAVELIYLTTGGWYIVGFRGVTVS